MQPERTAKTLGASEGKHGVAHGVDVTEIKMTLQYGHDAFHRHTRRTSLKPRHVFWIVSAALPVLPALLADNLDRAGGGEMRSAKPVEYFLQGSENWLCALI